MGNPSVKMGALTYARMIRALHGKPHTKAQLADATGLHVQTIGHYLNALHDEHMVHILDWERDRMGRQTTAIYVWGMGIDAQRTPKTVNQKMRDWRARKRAGLLKPPRQPAGPAVDPDKD